MSILIFENALLLDTREMVRREAMHVAIEGDRIREVSDRPIQAGAARRVDVRGRTLMPGLIDAHFHTFGIYLNMWRAEDAPLTFMTVIGLQRLSGALDRGFTTLRDTGGGDWGIRRAIDEGLAVGPRLFIAGKAISQTGGHGDQRRRTDDQTMCACSNAHHFITRIADGVDQVRHAARDELRKGADFLKLMCSGGVGSPNDPLENRQYSRAEVEAAVDEAEAWNTYVAAHAYAAHAIAHAVSCGVRSIEHGNMVDEATAALMAERGAIMVPTLVCYRETQRRGTELGLTSIVMGKLARVNQAGLQMLEICKRAGVKMGLGTDLMGELHVAQSDEFAIRAQVLSAAEIIASATRVNAELLNCSDELGVIEVGAYADLLVVDGDPLENLDLLRGAGAHLPVIMKGGAFHKNRLD
ncbi:MAG: amidohydrolase family protein [Proteobacteria bacterium]|nr:amidohydrolase family protein [Pseudomonadota bacterium]MBI3500032.1 amidohydrolase family protein [Pseudomonadota bacterium]